jgi:hypothetical protein
MFVLIAPSTYTIVRCGSIYFAADIFAPNGAVKISGIRLAFRGRIGGELIGLWKNTGFASL